jgi:hypothetical protein
MSLPDPRPETYTIAVRFLEQLDDIDYISMTYEDY